MSGESIRPDGTEGSSHVVRPPTKEVLSAAQALDSAIGLFLNALGRATDIGKFESDVEARLLYALIIRGAEGTLELARKDLVLLPAAVSVARATFETAIRALWMLDPDDPYEREVRWLAHLRADEVHFIKVAAELQKLGLDSGDLLEASKRYAEFESAVAARLPVGKVPLTYVPNLLGMLKSLERESQYVLYRHLSQYVHGTHLACSLYRRNLGKDKQLGEFVTAADWGIRDSHLLGQRREFPVSRGGLRFTTRAAAPRVRS